MATVSAPAQLAIAEAGPVPVASKSQWFTDPKLARALVGLAEDLFVDARQRRIPIRVLEPSAGRGNLVRAVLDRAPRACIVDAVDIDPRWRAGLEAIGDPRVRVEIADYLTRPAPAQRYTVAPCNVPFTDGEEVRHLAKLLDECDRITALLPVRTMHGRERYEQVWHRFDPRRADRDWYLRQKVHCISRPKFGTAGGMDEILLLDLRYRAPGDCIERWL